jgi:hypothetical protein
MLGGQGAAGANALLQSWEGENAYCAPPWSLIGRVHLATSVLSEVKIDTVGLQPQQRCHLQ